NTGADRALRRSLRTKAPDERELAAGPRTKEKRASEETPASTPTDSSALLGGLGSRRRDWYVTTPQGRGGAAHVVGMHLVPAVVEPFDLCLFADPETHDGLDRCEDDEGGDQGEGCVAANTDELLHEGVFGVGREQAHRQGAPDAAAEVHRGCPDWVV